VGVPREVVKCLGGRAQNTRGIPLGERFFFVRELPAGPPGGGRRSSP
jgi:hypothetical protein